MVNKIFVLGVGPGSFDCLTPAVAKAAEKCDLLAGGRRNLELFSSYKKEVFEIKGRLEPLLAIIKEKMVYQQVGVLVSGDPGLFSILPRLKKEFGGKALLVYPGIGAAQFFFARLGLNYEEARLISLHGRTGINLAEEAAQASLLVVFTDKENSPAAVCRALLKAGLGKKKVFIGEDLSYPYEKISCGKAEDFADHSGSDLNLVVISNENV